MLNLRNVTLAAALLLAFAVSAYADPYSDTYEVYGQVVAEVTDIRLIEPSTKRVAWSDPLESENLVEGHSVFVTMNIEAERVPVEGNVEILGQVQCGFTGNATTSHSTLPVIGSFWTPTGVEKVRAECSVYGQIVATPTIYCQVSGDWDCDPPAIGMAPVMAPTGVLLDFVTPDGQIGQAEELTFVATPPGETEPRSFYAYSVPIMLPWVDAEDGKFRNLHVPIPYDRLYEMDVWDFKFLYEDAVKRV